MKAMKGKLLKKLKYINPIGYSKTQRVLCLKASDGFVDSFPIETLTVCEEEEEEEEPKAIEQSSSTLQEPEIIDVSELMRDLEGDDDMDSDYDIDDKENIKPETESKDPVVSFAKILNPLKSQSGDSKKLAPLSEIDVSNFRRPELDSGSVFEPNLSAAFEEAVVDVKPKAKEAAETRARTEEDEENRDPLFDFEEKCPPGGSDSVILYTTGLKGIRKTFQECNVVRFLLESSRVLFYERDVSMHSEYREELWTTLGGKAVPPRLFVRGRDIGGAERVLGLHEQGKLRRLLQGIPIDRSESPCEGCSGIRFVMCFRCNGSRKVVSDDLRLTERCAECNENGLIICPICS